ncbi:AAA family ATPase [Hyphomonas atlantica]|uniref:YhaN AAA domain-containing protein n=1 Tax=Hyphomonas atlantica TaxID=1280948 RepID=A0A059E0Z1_9PROT|nr:AAA family ATPase [Hyphomonas atlantica]KCZ60732.1 hypothetical protein HY36_17270 [Hyphomonas atlantica]
MRFSALHLTRFGCFTNESIDFGSISDAPDFHIVYGDNEAGKSTLRDVITCLLYGIPARTEYDFIHDYKALQIGAELDTSAGPLSTVRVKANRDSLRSPEGAVLSEDVLRREMLALTETDFINLFSLDLQSLLDGGADILQAKGDLGALLFAGASGLSSVTSTLEHAREQAREFFKPRATSTALAQSLKRLKEIDGELKTLDVHAPEYRRMKRKVDEAKRAYEAAADEQKQRRAAFEKGKAVLQAIEPWRELRERQDRLEAFGPLPPADDEALERARQLQAELKALNDAKDALEARLKRTENELDDLKPPPHQEKLVNGLEALIADDREARARTAALDLPSRHDELKSLERDMNSHLARLGEQEESEPEALLVSKTDAANIRTLAETGEKHSAAFEQAVAEQDKAISDLAVAKDELSALTEPMDIAPLYDAITSYRSDLDAARLEDLEADVEASKRNLDRALLGLAPWSGTPEELQSLTPPSASDLEDLHSRYDEVAATLERLQSDRRNLNRSIENETAQLDEMDADPEIVSDDTAGKLLKTRDDLWTEHRRAIEQGVLDQIKLSATAFETAMGENDVAVTKRIAHASSIGQIKERRLKQIGAIAEREAIDKAIEEDIERLRALDQELARLAGTTGLPASISASAIKAWRGAWGSAHEALNTYQDRRASFEKKQKRFTAAASALRQELKSVGVEDSGSDETVLAAALRTLDDLRSSAEAYRIAKAEHDTLARQQRQRTDAVEKAKTTLEEWEKEWNRALKELTFAQGRPAAIKARLDDLASLAGTLDERKSLARRVALMEASETTFADAVVQLSLNTGVGDRNAPHFDLLGTLKSESRNLDARTAQRLKLSEQIDQNKEELEETVRKLAALDKEAIALCERSNAENIAHCIETLSSASAARTLADEIGDRRRRLSNLLATEAETEWSQMLAPLLDSMDALAGAEAELKVDQAQIEIDETRVREFYAEWKDAERAQEDINDDESAARLQQERTTLLAEIEQGARRYISLKAGALIVDEAVRLFRDQHRGAMLKSASDAFSKITRGRYPRLVTVSADDRETLVAERDDKTTLSADKLSTGTRAQLYLALRIAGHAEYAKSQTPLPFIADDILEAFDNHRAKETLTLLSSMAESGQVIYLTHHEHLVDMARTVAPDRCKIHRLNSKAAGKGMAAE